MASMVATNVVRALERVGLSTYEARAYAALLRSGPATGYQLSRNSGVPRSRIYETLEKLADRGMVITRQDRPQLHAAVPCDEVLARKGKEMTEALACVRDCCAAVDRTGGEEGVWNISGRANVLAKAQAMLDAAREEVSVVAAAGNLSELEPALRKAAGRGCRVRIVVCGTFSSDVGEVYRHSFAPGRCDDVALVVDSSQALVGLTEPAESAPAAWSRAPGFVHIAEEYVLHEVFIARALSRLDATTVVSLGELYKEVFQGDA